MRSYLTRRARHRRGRDAGITMVAVLASFTILTVIVLGSLAYLAASTKASRFEQDNDLALAAAQSGVNDLLARLRENPDYLNEVAATKTLDTGYCRNPAVGGKNTGASAEQDHFATDCGWTEEYARFYKYDDSSAQASQEFHYTVLDYSAIPMSAEVLSTGRSQGVVRSVKARIERASSKQYLYLSDYELVDPSDYTAYPTRGANMNVCGAGYPSATTLAELGYKYQVDAGTRPARQDRTDEGYPRDCLEPSFREWDYLDGPVHSNDTIKSNGAHFLSDFTTSDTRCVADASVPSTWNTCVNGSADFHVPPSIAEREFLPELPPKSDPAVLDEIANRGCAYDGPTRIIFKNDGTMTVWSRYTDNPDAATTGRCGTAAELDAGVTLPIPDGSLIYVRDLDAAAHPDLSKKIEHGAIGGPSGQELPLGSYVEAYDDLWAPAANSTYEIELAMKMEDMYANQGNLWVEGEVKGTITMWADSSVVITGDLTTVNDAEDLIGVMASESVQIYNPVLEKYAASPYPGDPNKFIWQVPSAPERASGWPTGDLRIEAAIIAGTGSFRLQNWKYGGYLGTLTVVGSIAQNFRGVMAEETAGASTTPLNGYAKQYKYNEKLNEKRPLLFEPLQSGTWVIAYQEKAIPSAFVEKAP